MLLKLWSSHVVKKKILLASDILSDGACEYGTFQATLKNADVSASASLYRNGIGCGACCQVKSICGGAPGCLNHETPFSYSG